MDNSISTLVPANGGKIVITVEGENEFIVNGESKTYNELTMQELDVLSRNNKWNQFIKNQEKRGVKLDNSDSLLVTEETIKDKYDEILRNTKHIDIKDLNLDPNIDYSKPSEFGKKFQD